MKVRASQTQLWGCGSLQELSVCALLYLGTPFTWAFWLVQSVPPVQVLTLISRGNSRVYENNFLSKGSNASKSLQLLTLQMRRGWGDKSVSWRLFKA